MSFPHVGPERRTSTCFPPIMRSGPFGFSLILSRSRRRPRCGCFKSLIRQFCYVARFCTREIKTNGGIHSIKNSGYNFRKFRLTNGTVISRSFRKRRPPCEVFLPTEIFGNFLPGISSPFDFPPEISRTFCWVVRFSEIQQFLEYLGRFPFNQKLLNFWKANHWTDIDSRTKIIKLNGFLKFGCSSRCCLLFRDFRKMRFHSSLEISRSLNQIFFHRMASAPENVSRKFPYHLFPFRNFRFNEKRPRTRAYNESINHCVLFALSQLSVGYFCLFKNNFFNF